METISLRAHKGRPAIAMIELIFAIVVIGITLLSVPLMVNQANQSTYVTLQQEAIAAAASDMSLILSREWDEANTDTSEAATILTGTGSNFTQADRSNIQSRTYITSTGALLSASSIGADSGDLDDIDDVNGITTILKDEGGDDLIDMTMTISTTVGYLNDSSLTANYPFSSSGMSNIKGITITLTSGGATPELQKEIKLNAFACNIGSYKLDRKVF